MKVQFIVSVATVLISALSGTAAASSLRGRVAVNSDSVDSEDYYYYPEAEDYEFVEGEDPEDLYDEDMELYVKQFYGPRNYGGNGQSAAKQAWRAERYARNRAKKAAQSGYYGGARVYGGVYGGPVYGGPVVYNPGSAQGAARAARQARKAAQAAARTANPYYGPYYGPY